MPTFSRIKETSDGALSLSFCDITPRHIVTKKTVPTKEFGKSPDEECSNDDTLFTCFEEGCMKTFQRFSLLQTHLNIGKHKYNLERKSLLDKAMMRYAENLESSGSAIDTLKIDKVCLRASTPSDHVLPLPMGWTLKNIASRCHLTKIQKKYLTDLFLLGEKTG